MLAETKIYVSVEGPGQQLVLNGDLALLGQVLDAMRVQQGGPKKGRRQAAPPAARAPGQEVRHAD